MRGPCSSAGSRRLRARSSRSPRACSRARSPATTCSRCSATPSGALSSRAPAGRSARIGRRSITTSGTSKSPSWWESWQRRRIGHFVSVARLPSHPAMSIPHVDVKAQYAPLIPQLQEAFARTLESGKFIFGPEVEAFEREAAALLGTQETVSCANGTDALVLVLDAMGIGPGDEVICPSFTFYATAEAIARRGAVPVFADIDPVTLNLDPAEVERKLTKQTKAIMPVHLFGRPAPDFSGLGVPVIEDAAQAFGAGGIATSIASTFSFFPTKNLFALGDGGLIAVNDSTLAERLRMLRFHGSRAKKEFEYVGYNSRLDALQASFLRIFLRHLGGWNAERREAAALYTDLLDPLLLEGLLETPVDEDGHVYHM